MTETLQAIAAIVLIDLALSGDNALVIGMAARGLPVAQRRTAIVLGGFGAVGLRVAGSAGVTLLLAIPYLQLAAAVALVVIAYRLVRPSPDHTRTVGRAATLRAAILTILIADAAMSLENVLGVGAAAHGNIALLVFGLALSIPIVLFGSSFIVGLLERYPRGIWLGAIALLWTAAELVLDEPTIALRHTLPWAAELLLTGVLLAMLIAYREALRYRRRVDPERVRLL
ncbi:MAG TPA: YjbE family putative metal transport protein [Candidatus Limnocylindria bacterium]|nr:YjbE family putative metal transport protein [Candidatus Limnocylindria bacterium]